MEINNNKIQKINNSKSELEKELNKKINEKNKNLKSKKYINK